MKILVFGFIFGIITPFISIFIGLQLSPTLANILMFPILILGYFFEEPFGYLAFSQKLFLVFFSGVFYSFIFFLVKKLNEVIPK